MSLQGSDYKLATTIKVVTPSISLPPNLKPWQRIDLPACVQSRLFGDWAQYYNRWQLNKKAIEYFSRSITVCGSNGDTVCSRVSCQPLAKSVCQKLYDTLNKRSRCWRSLAQAELALKDSRHAHQLLKQEGISKASIVLSKCDALFDCNRFEDNLVMLHMEERNYPGKCVKNCFRLRKNRAIGVLEDTLGDSLHSFLLDTWPLIMEAAHVHRTSVTFMPRPLWQQLSNNNGCDLDSVVNKEKPLLSPLEKARRQVDENVYNYHYLSKAANDATLLHQLKNDHNLLNPLLRESTPYLAQLTTEQYRIVRKFTNMLHARRPLYHSKQEKCRISQICERNREKYLYRVQYQCRRDCHSMLREVRQRRQERDIERLTEYVEHIMSTNIVLKTFRVLPWKWEFITDVFNILGLAHVDRCTLPQKIDILNWQNYALIYMLPKDRFKDLSLDHGSHNVYAEIARHEERMNCAAKKVERLEERLIYSRYGIERTYLLFEIARCHFKEARFDKALTMAHKAANEARSCNSTVWHLNCTFLISQVHAAFNRFQRLSQSLNRAKQLAEKLKSLKMMAFLALLIAINNFKLDNYRWRHLDASQRKARRRKDRQSLQSIDSSDNHSGHTIR
ncbi:outer dynein arm-docking complex subunit 4 [Drosophila grimshawi]|uniref:GH24905 n=1 Tax=Drosophila grimshawi TaxID=7222 RepID=B4JNX0_DROGR|nr:outer dynein arm-docking complex subunit 4 [Drosophila grimshawi]EDV92413.1 GH24905 [Drosophila grimshawi]